MIGSDTKHKNWREFENETSLYEVEPIGRAAESWMNLSDVSEKNKSKPLDFEQAKGKKLYARFVRINDKSYWKMYIVDQITVNIVYIPTGALNPIRLYKP